MKNLKFIMENTPNQLQLIQFIQGIEFIEQKESYVKFLTSVAKFHILAYSAEEIVGWVALIEVNPATIFLYEWHPFVLPSPQEDEIKQKLLREACIVTKNAHIPNLRTFVPVKNSDTVQFKKLEELYLSAGMNKTHVQNCMIARLSEKNLKDVSIPLDLTIINMNDENRGTLLNAYEIVFKDSFDDFINSLDEQERKYWDLIDENQLADVAVVLKKKNDIIGFIGAHEDDGDIELGPVGVIPKYRGKKIANLLLNHVVQKLLEIGRNEVYLEVGSRNTVAFSLYSSYGFRKVSEKHGFLIKTN